jgi:hypothetical protein
MREIIGTTTEDEFDALPLAVRRKVRAISTSNDLEHRMQLCDAVHTKDV